MQRVGNTGRLVVSRRRRTVALAASVVALSALSACTSGGGGGPSPAAHQSVAGGSSPAPSSSASSTVAAVPAVITSSPAAGAQAISPAARVKVNIAHGTLTAVKMLNAKGNAVSGRLATDGTSWQSTEDLGYAKTYRLTASGRDQAGLPVTKSEHFTTLTPNNMTMPTFDNIYGTAISNGATYGVGMVVRLHFDESVNRKLAEKALHVTTTPAVTGGWYWDDDQNVYWRPQHFFTPGTKVRMDAKVYGVRVGTGLYGQADQSASFTIGAKHLSIANAQTHQVKVYFSDKLVRTMPTSMGQGGYIQGKNGSIALWTMPGTYTVINHENPAIMSSDSYGLPASSPYGYAPEAVYWSTKISIDGIYLHELDATVWAQGHQNVSHGCLNLNLSNAKWYYQHSVVGDVVQVVHSGGPGIQFGQGGQWSVPWSAWLKGSAL